MHCGDAYWVLYHTTPYLKKPYDTRTLLLFCDLYTVVESIYIMADMLLTAYQPKQSLWRKIVFIITAIMQIST